jgi:S-adenosylmethionine decarboxylase
MQGLHLTADLHRCGCPALWLTDAELLGQLCLQEVEAAGLQAVAQLFHTFPSTRHGPGGVTATVLLAESHLCVHTWPEQCAVTLDVYVCNFGGDHSARAQSLLDNLTALLAPEQVETNRLHRGKMATPFGRQITAG